MDTLIGFHREPRNPNSYSRACCPATLTVMWMFLLSVGAVAAVFGFAIALGSHYSESTQGLMVSHQSSVKAYVVARSTTRGALSTWVPCIAWLMSSDGGAYGRRWLWRL